MSRRPRTALALVAATLLLTVAGCGGGSDDAGPGSPGSTGSTTSPTEARASEQADDSPHNAADVTFAQEMVPHHRQAVVMAELAKGHDLDADVEDLADRIGRTQSREIDTMTGWLRGWGEQVPTGDPAGRMKGMLSDDQLTQLRKAPDPAFQSLWLTRMVGHHQGAIPMAQTELDEGRNPEAIALARRIIRTQKAELYEMGGLIGQ